jgi:AcrR family transcriptional regulator
MVTRLITNGNIGVDIVTNRTQDMTKAKRAREYHHGELKQALIDAAISLFNERGDASFGLRDLAVRVGVSHPALYRHFADRSALFRAIAVEGFTLYGETQQSALLHAPEDPTDRLVLLARNHVGFALSHPAHFRIMFGAKVGEHKLNDDELNVVARPTLQLIATTAASFGKDDPLDFALILWSAVHGISLLSLDGQLVFFGKTTVESVDRLLEQCVRDLIKGYTS